MDSKKADCTQTSQELKIIFVAELFSKLPAKDQDAVIAQIEALLSHE